MYTLDQIKDKIIWNFRDPRSGSTWFVNKLAMYLNRSKYFVDMENDHIFSLSTDNQYYLKQEQEQKIATINEFFTNRTVAPDDFSKILNTHDYRGLKFLEKYNHPIVFRNVRRNKTLQFCSLVVANDTWCWNTISLEHRKSIRTVTPFSIDLSKVHCFIERLKEADKLWQDYSKNYESEIVYYEDLLQGYSCKLVDLTLLMNPDEDTSTPESILKKSIEALPLKLPYQYEEIIVNYQQIDQILKQEFDHY